MARASCSSYSLTYNWLPKSDLLLRNSLLALIHFLNKIREKNVSYHGVRVIILRVWQRIESSLETVTNVWSDWIIWNGCRSQGPKLSSHGQRRLIRLGEYPGWSVSLGAHATLLVLSWGGSCIIIVCVTIYISYGKKNKLLALWKANSFGLW